MIEKALTSLSEFCWERMFFVGISFYNNNNNIIIIILYLYSADYITMSKSALQVPKIIIVIIISNLY